MFWLGEYGVVDDDAVDRFVFIGCYNLLLDSVLVNPSDVE
jgi:hypothetical protein